jgi:hypothetical protein
MTKDLPPEVKERFKRFDAHLPSLDDPTLIVLKGHLLAEEILENLIRARCCLPEALDGIEIGFFLKARLARALIGNSHPNGLILPEDVWAMLEALNSLRNELAHALEPKKLEVKIKKFLSFAPTSKKTSKTKQKPNAALYSAIIGTLSYLACFETTALTGEIPPRLPENV